MPTDTDSILDLSEDAEIRVREATPGDLSFIMSGWLKSFRVGTTCEGVGNDDYYGAHKQILQQLLRRCTVLIACDAAAPDVDVGFICAEMLDDSTRLLHYAYVKDDFRRHGICDMMLAGLDAIEPAARTVCTHRTRRGAKLMRLKGWGYNPYILWSSLPGGWLRGEDGRLLPESRPLLESR